MLALATTVAFLLLTAALALAIARLALGPSLADRVVALDLIAMILAAVIAVFALSAGQPVLLDALVVLAIIGFFGTVAFARYIEKRASDEG